MSLRLNGQLLLVGAIGAILASLLIFLIPGPDGLGGPGVRPRHAGDWRGNDRQRGHGPGGITAAGYCRKYHNFATSDP